MAKRPKRPRDPLALGKVIGDIATGQSAERKQHLELESDAERWGRIGGAKGGQARASKLSAEQKREIAQRAARARWEKHGR